MILVKITVIMTVNILLNEYDVKIARGEGDDYTTYHREIQPVPCVSKVGKALKSKAWT